MSVYFFYASLFLYLASATFYEIYLIVAKRTIQRLGHYALLLGFSVHALATFVRYLSAGYTPITNTHEALSFFALCIAGFFLYFKRVYRMEILGCIFVPVLTLILLSASVFPTDIKPLPPILNSYWLPIHTTFSFTGNAVFLISFFISLVYLAAEREIKRKRFSATAARFPSLEALDSINYKCMSYGFLFLTVGIMTGSIWANTAWGSYWSWDPKETWSLITWIVYAILIHNRLTIGWRGRKTAYMMIIGFLSMLMTFLGVNFFVGGLHSYI
jgi:cytochrome c-type biogenesis protein CcsB